MAEELIQRGLTEHGMPFGDHEFYNIGSTNIRTLRRHGIVPNKDYGAADGRKPDALLVDRHDVSNVSVLAVIENKTPAELDSPAKKEAAVVQCVSDYCKPLGAKIGVVTDGNEYIWVNPQLPGDGFQLILREDGYPLHLPFAWRSDPEVAHTLEVLSRILTEISPTNSQLQQEALQNPSALADSVWQTIYLASGENPDACLATFAEIFVFKYLSDLNVLVRNQSGVPIGFGDVLAVDTDRCLVYYFEHVRPHIKLVFPASTTDGTSIINDTVLDPAVAEHNFVFHEILTSFESFGTLTNIDPEFKSRLYEKFLKKSISQKNWGQFFTPRNIIKAMIEMSEIEHLPDGAKVHDPACGVGGFVLEPVLTKRQRDHYFDDTGSLHSRLQYTGYDRVEKTIILAKANMLIHLNELMREHPGATEQFAALFNETFTSVHTSILGSLAHTSTDEFDLIMTNPPFVTTGTSTIKKFIRETGQLSLYYAVNAMGVEGLFVEQIVRSLKPGGRAFVILPEGIMNRLIDSKLRRFVRDQCIIEGIVSLPKNAFYTSSKKTYILALTKKPLEPLVQTEPVFTYLVVNTGETLDAHRFECDNDLPEMVRLFKYFKADKHAFVSPVKQCKVWPVERFDPDRHWSIDRWWTHDERVELGIVEEEGLTTIGEFAERLQGERDHIGDAIATLAAMDAELQEPEFAVDISLANQQYFDLFIGKRKLIAEMRNIVGGTIPVFSANVNEPFGMLDQSNIPDFEHDCVLWGIDGNFEFSVIERNNPFATTDHCGCIRIVDADVDAQYLYCYLSWIRAIEGLDRGLRANLTNMRNISIRFPILVDDQGIPKTKPPNKEQTGVGEILYLDLDGQRHIAQHFQAFQEIKTEIAQRTAELTALKIPPLM